MTKPVTRYRMDLGGPEPCVVPEEDADGEWVKYEDHARLESELAVLSAVVEPKMPKYTYELLSAPASMRVSPEKP